MRVAPAEGSSALSIKALKMALRRPFECISPRFERERGLEVTTTTPQAMPRTPRLRRGKPDGREPCSCAGIAGSTSITADSRSPPQPSSPAAAAPSPSRDLPPRPPAGRPAARFEVAEDFCYSGPVHSPELATAMDTGKAAGLQLALLLLPPVASERLQASVEGGLAAYRAARFSEAADYYADSVLRARREAIAESVQAALLANLASCLYAQGKVKSSLAVLEAAAAKDCDPYIRYRVTSRRALALNTRAAEDASEQISGAWFAKSDAWDYLVQRALTI